MNQFWRYFPAVYLIPFVLATTRFEGLSGVSELARWGVMLVAVCFAASQQFRRGRGTGVTGFDFSAIGFLGVCLASYSWSVYPTYTVFRTGSMVLLYLASFWAMWRWVDVYSEDWFWKVLLRTLGGFMAINLLLGSALLPGELIAGRFRGVFENPNNIGMLVAVSLPPAFIYWLRGRGKIDLAIVVVLGLNLMAAGSRTAMLGAGVACIGIMIGLLKKRPKLAIPLVAVLVVGATGFTQTSFFKERILREESLEGASSRTEFWEHGTRFIDRRPELGHGFGTDGRIWEHYGINMKSLQLRGYGVMSSYYGMAVNLGRPVTYLFFGGFWLWVLWGILRYRKNLMHLGYLLTVMGGLLVCVFETALYSAGNCFSYLFWIVVMLCVRRAVYQREKIGLRRDGALAKKRKPVAKRKKPVSVASRV